ncbi:MAG: hypothetical protein MMC23_007052 [Stictis urceolatum]|nr:hypothetical protein [Stictis urceolata]
MDQRQLPPAQPAHLQTVEFGSKSSQSTSQSAARLRANKPASIDTTSYTNPSAKTTEAAAPSLRRKPVGSVPPSALSPRRPTFPIGGKVVAVGRESGDNFSVNNVQPPWAPWQQQQQRTASPRRQVRDFDGPPPHVFSPDIPQSPGLVPFHELSADQAREVLLGLDTTSYSPSTLTHARNSDPPRTPLTQRSRPNHQVHRSETMPGRAEAPGPIQISVNDHYGVNGPPTPNKQGMSKFSSFFAWKGNVGSSPINESSPTTISDRSTPAQSPNGTSLSSFPINGKPLPHAIDTNKANAPSHALFASASYPQAPPTPAMSMQLEEMEEELRDISAELAGSIRREMELEEEVERLQYDGPNALEKDKRTSDYYSDSGTSSVRDPDLPVNRTDDLEKLKRRSEQEKAQMKLDLSQKLQEERGRRKGLEDHIKNLEDHIRSLEQGVGRTGGTGRVLELESALEDNRRRLSEERKHKENFEDLISALQNDLVQHKNERDNLRDEVVPALRARVEGLEAESSEYQKLVYENTRMQQELSGLKSSRAFGSIAEEDGAPQNKKMGLTRSSSMMRGSNSLSRSNSVSNKPQESRESLADRVKDIESQRDALHRALKSLLERQKFQTREHEKRVKALEQERDQALEASSPRRRGYEKEVGDLRYEINELRKRADDALEQKWQCEKGLGGLKKDLDRAEQETSSLRSLLVENDILVPDLSNMPAGDGSNSTLATSATLEKAYKELREAQAQSITRLQQLKGITPSAADDAKTVETLNILLQSMSNAEAERDYAQKQAESFRAQAETLQDVSSYQEDENAGLANQLQASAGRIDVLSSQVRQQLTQNSELRERLAIAIGTGEREQKVSTTRINQLQDKLRELEDKLMTAQQQSEDSIQAHEDDVLLMRQSSNTKLQRLRTPGSGNRTPNSPLSPMIRSPRINRTTTGDGVSMSEALRTESLEKKVRELESALREADLEMGEVVQRMNRAQIDVMELQNARDEAMMQTRSLQNQIQKENEAVKNIAK